MHSSQFLPSDFSLDRPLALIAGKGYYPVEVAQAAQFAGVRVCLVSFEGETLPQLVESFPVKDHVQIRVGQVGKLLKALKLFGAPYALMAGQITPRRLFRGMYPDLRAIRLLMQVKQRNAESLFRALANEMSRAGTQLLDARSFLDEALVSSGVLSRGRWIPSQDLVDQGLELAQSLAHQNVGQGVVLDQYGTVLAVEAFEGTDAMLERAGQFGAKNAFFVKTVKPKQDYRFDVPVFGPQTVKHMRVSGIQAAALASGKTLILNKLETLRLCKRYRVSLLGV